MHNDCASCTHPGIDCIPHLMTLSSADLIEWCRFRKDALRLTNGDIAGLFNVPKGTIDRIFSSDGTDFRFSTIQPIICVLAECKPSEMECGQQLELNADLILENHDLQKDLEHEQMLSKRLDESIKSWKHASYAMMSLCAVMMIPLAGYLSSDIQTGNAGFFQQGYISPLAMLMLVGIALVCVAYVRVIHRSIRIVEENKRANQISEKGIQEDDDIESGGI